MSMLYSDHSHYSILGYDKGYLNNYSCKNADNTNHRLLDNSRNKGIIYPDRKSVSHFSNTIEFYPIDVRNINISSKTMKSSYSNSCGRDSRHKMSDMKRSNRSSENKSSYNISNKPCLKGEIISSHFPTRYEGNRMHSSEQNSLNNYSSIHQYDDMHNSNEVHNLKKREFYGGFKTNAPIAGMYKNMTPTNYSYSKSSYLNNTMKSCGVYTAMGNVPAYNIFNPWVTNSEASGSTNMPQDNISDASSQSEDSCHNCSKYLAFWSLDLHPKNEFTAIPTVTKTVEFVLLPLAMLFNFQIENKCKINFEHVKCLKPKKKQLAQSQLLYHPIICKVWCKKVGRYYITVSG